MDAPITLKVLELLASKICHDLISPVGAISNGVEILDEMGADEGVTELISFSASQASAKLKTMRVAYGLGGADPSIKPEDIHKVFGEYISGEKRLSQSWDPYEDIGIESVPGRCKALLCCLILAAEALPKGGIVSAGKGDEGVLLITAEGTNASLREGVLEALENKTPESKLEAKLVHAYVTGLILKTYGFSIEIDESKDDFIFLRIKRH